MRGTKEENCKEMTIIWKWTKVGNLQKQKCNNNRQKN